VVLSIRCSLQLAREAEDQSVSRSSHIREGGEWAPEAPLVMLVSVSAVRECPVFLAV
jgi:hypothetical protein